MRFSPSSEEQAHLEIMSAEERFHYAITRIGEAEEVWSLGDENGWLIREQDEQQYISIWPYRQMAMEYAAAELPDCHPISVSLEHFLYGLLKQCQESDIALDVNPGATQPGYIVSASHLYEVLDNMVETDTYFVEG